MSCGFSVAKTRVQPFLPDDAGVPNSRDPRVAAGLLQPKRAKRKPGRRKQDQADGNDDDLSESQNEEVSAEPHIEVDNQDQDQNLPEFEMLSNQLDALGGPQPLDIANEEDHLDAEDGDAAAAAAVHVVVDSDADSDHAGPPEVLPLDQAMRNERAIRYLILSLVSLLLIH